MERVSVRMNKNLQIFYAVVCTVYHWSLRYRLGQCFYFALIINNKDSRKANMRLRHLCWCDSVVLSVNPTWYEWGYTESPEIREKSFPKRQQRTKTIPLYWAHLWKHHSGWDCSCSHQNPREGSAPPPALLLTEIGVSMQGTGSHPQPLLLGAQLWQEPRF